MYPMALENLWFVFFFGLFQAHYTNVLEHVRYLFPLHLDLSVPSPMLYHSMTQNPTVEEINNFHSQVSISWGW